jgi:hypothetical protein
MRGHEQRSSAFNLCHQLRRFADRTYFIEARRHPGCATREAKSDDLGQVRRPNVSIYSTDLNLSLPNQA